jgi:hypothetical protein
VSLIVHVGPTLPAAEVRAALPDARVLGPVGLGDVYCEARDGARTIAIIDGVFDQALAVRHKEILWALSRGVRVLGAASMGALRAAELAAFGMEGVGAVFEAFASGALEDDDEVAVAHGTQDDGYVRLSEAMVDVRATIERTVAAGWLDAQAGAALIAHAKSLYYADRAWPAILGAASALNAEALSRLRDAVRGPGRVELKAQDARALLGRLQAEPAPARPAFRFEPTEAWHLLARQLDAERTRPGEAAELAARGHGLLPSMSRAVRRRGRDVHEAVWRQCLERALALELARRTGSALGDDDAQAASETFRRERGLLTGDAMAAWLQENRLDAAGYSAFVHDDALASRVARDARALVLAQLPAVLCARGELPEIWAEAIGEDGSD